MISRRYTHNTRTLIDGHFFNCYKALRSTAIAHTIYCIFKTLFGLSLVSALLLRYWPEFSDYTTCCILLCLTNLSEVTIATLRLCKLSNLPVIFDIAYLLGHQKPVPLSLQQNYHHLNRHTSLQNYVSDQYDFLYPYDVDLSPETKQLLQQNTKNLISRVLLQHHTFKVLSSLTEMVSLCVLVLLILLLSNSLIIMESANILVLLFVILEAISRVQLLLSSLLVLIICVLIILMICLSPLLFLCYGRHLFYLLTGRPNDSTVPIFDPNSSHLQIKKYNVATVLSTDPQCRICLQYFDLGDRYVQLPCDSHHVFHEFCIKTWFHISYTCPLCRKNIGLLAQEV